MFCLIGLFTGLFTHRQRESNMASAKKKAGQFHVEVLSREEALKEISAGGEQGGRVSKYEPLLRAAQKLSGDDVLRVRLGKNEVTGFRSYLRQRLGDNYLVKSAKIDDGVFMTFVFLKSEDAGDAQALG